MKRITTLIMMLVATISFAQPADNAATPPDREDSDVISLYGDAYTNVAGINYDPNWGQSGHTQVDTEFDPGTGDLILAYPNFNYQGTDINTSLNAASMEFLHVDVWVPAGNSRQLKVSPINNGTGIGEVLVEVPVTPGEWNSVDLPKSAFTGMTWDSVFQLKFDGQFNADGSANTAPWDVYLDNIYFYKEAVDPIIDASLSDLQVDGSTIPGFSSGTVNYDYSVSPGTTDVPEITAATPTNSNANVVITQATEIPGDATVQVTAEDGTTTETYTVSYVFVGPPTPAPTPPTIPANEVLSIYSDAYAQRASNFDAGFCGFDSTEEIQIDGNNTMQYKFNNCQGIILNEPADVSNMTTINFDFYVEEGTDLLGSVISLKLNQTNGNAIPEDDIFLDNVITEGTNPAIVTGEWVEVELTVDLSAFTALDEIVITAGTLANVMYYDNFYISGGTLNSATFETAEFKTFPNPTNDVWNIQTTENIQNVKIFNTVGRLVKEVNVTGNEATVNASDLSTGIYFAKISNEFNQTKTIKLIKK